MHKHIHFAKFKLDLFKEIKYYRVKYSWSFLIPFPNPILLYIPSQSNFFIIFLRNSYYLELGDYYCHTFFYYYYLVCIHWYWKFLLFFLITNMLQWIFINISLYICLRIPLIIVPRGRIVGIVIDCMFFICY